MKRHFQKCSIRRGNPTGATHLSHSQAHLKKQGVKKAQAPTSIDTTFPSGPQGGPNSAGSIYSDAGLGVNMGGSSGHLQTDGSVPSGDGTSAHSRRNMANPSNGINRSGFGYAQGQGAPPSQPSSGSSTPLTAKSTGQFPQQFSADASQQRMAAYNDMHHRNDPSSMPGSHFDGNSFDW